jgi:hypothetical protein
MDLTEIPLMEDTLGLVLLLLTGIVALIMGIFLLKEHLNSRKPEHALWGMAMIVLFVSGVLIILYDWAILDERLVPVVAALIPIGFAAGLLYAAYEEVKWARYFLMYQAVLLVIFLIFAIVGDDPPTAFVLLTHIPSGMLIVYVPFVTGLNGVTEKSSWLFSLGGALISVGGMLMGMLETDDPPLNADEIHDILPGLLLIVGALITFGIILPSKWKVDVPFLSKADV